MFAVTSAPDHLSLAYTQCLHLPCPPASVLSNTALNAAPELRNPHAHSVLALSPLPFPLQWASLCLAALATRAEGLRDSIARLLISKNASTTLDYRAVSYQLLYITYEY